MATIKDVAKAAGVSISTVSYALNADPRIPEKTAAVIRRIAGDIGYFPSAAARNLKKRTTQTILVAISDFGGPVYHNLLDGIHHELAKSNYTMIVSTGVSSENLLKERSADGAIIADIHIADETLAKVAMNFRPIIVLDRRIDVPGIVDMTIDNERAMADLTHEAIARGYRRIAYVHGVRETYDDTDRFAGFRRAMRAAGAGIFAEYWGTFTKSSGHEVIAALLEAKATLPDMFVCANDEMAIGIMDGLSEAGLHVPEDVGVSGFDDIELASYYRPGLSTIRIDHSAWGRAIAATAVAILQGKDADVHKQQGVIILRESF
ncbi:MAG: LacI family DNA-binding transcriptional regulator [Candidatus Izemoplasmatales bacterium]